MCKRKCCSDPIFTAQEKYLRGKTRKYTVYIIRNNRITPEWSEVKPEIKAMAIRSINALTKSQGIGDLFRIYTFSMRDDFDYNLAYIPENFKDKPKTQFDKAYMNKLFDLGYEFGSTGQSWRTYPPQYTPLNKRF